MKLWYNEQSLRSLHKIATTFNGKKFYEMGPTAPRGVATRKRFMKSKADLKIAISISNSMFHVKKPI